MADDVSAPDRGAAKLARQARTQRLLDHPARHVMTAEITSTCAEPGTFDHVRLTADVVAVTKKTTRTGLLWAILRVADPTGEIDVLVFPRCLAATGSVGVGDTIVVECLAAAGEGRVELGAQTIDVISHGD